MTMKQPAAKTPPRKTAMPPKASSAAAPKSASKPAAKPAPKAAAKTSPKASGRAMPKTPKAASREAMLARVESVRLSQRSEGHFDCFGRAKDGYCDQGQCAHHAECLSVSRLLHSL